jgi:hypothetical protein
MTRFIVVCVAGFQAYLTEGMSPGDKPSFVPL